MNPQTLTSTLSSLRKAGSVFGVIFSRQSEVLFSDAPFIPERINGMAEMLDDIALHFQANSRSADQLAFGYDGGNLLIVFDEIFRMIVFHSNQDEVDFIAKAGRAFIKDYQMSIFARELKKGKSIEDVQSAVLQKEADEIERGPEVPHNVPTETLGVVDPTEPITPIQAMPDPEPEPEIEVVHADTNHAAETASASGYADELEPAVAEQTAVVEEIEMTSTLADAIEEEYESSAVVLDKDITAPILAAVQPESTLPPPRKASIKR